MGGPKALTQLDGRPFLEHVAETARAGGCRSLFVVTAHQEVRALVARLGLESVVNPSPEAGMFSSVLLGLAAALRIPGVHSVLCWPVDVPKPRAETIASMITESRAGAMDVLRPQCEGARGHPILIRRPCAARLLACDPADTLRSALRSLGARLLDIPVDDPGTVLNLNHPCDISGTES